MDRLLLRRIGRRLLPLGWAAVLAAPLATHLALATGRFAVPAAVLAIAELAALGGLATRSAPGWGPAVAVAAALLLGLRLLQPGWAGRDGLVAAAYLSHALIYGGLLVLFVRSLRPGRVALATGMAARLRGSLTPAIVAYTRNVTKAWCVFFTLQLATSLVLLTVAPLAVWSLFVNVLDAPAVLAMFAGEYAVRRWRFRDEPHRSLLEGVRMFARSRAAGP